MAKTTLILAAVTLITGGVRAKDGAIVPHTVQPGEELTEDVVAKLGLDQDGIADLLARGAVAEIDVRAAAPADDGAAADALAAANKRADEAEAKVKDLEARLAAAGKPAQ